MSYQRVLIPRPGNRGTLPALWPRCRVTGWRHVKGAAARIGGDCAKPRGLRHVFAVAASQASVAPDLVQPWLGYASLKTTAIYAEVSGAEEFGFAG